MHRHLVVGLLVGVVFVGASVTRGAAQPADRNASGANPVESGSGQGAAPPLEPPLPVVQDAMLEPVPPPPPAQTLKTWRQALELVRTRSTALGSSRAQVELVTAQARQALAQALPTLVANANVNHHLLLGEGPIPPYTLPLRTGPIPDPATSWRAGLTLRVPVFAPREWYDTATARRAVAAAELSLADLERQLLGTVAEAIVSVVTAERMAEVSRVALETALSALDLNQRRARLGAANAIDVLRAEQEVTLTRAQVITTSEGVRRTREALGLALGANEAWGVTPDINVATLAADARSSCERQQSIEGRPDVQAAEAEVGLSERAVTSIQYSYLPTVDFTSTASYEPRIEASPNREHFTWTIGGVLSFTIYDGGLRSSAREVAVQRSELARYALTQTKLRAKIEVDQARRSVQVAEANLTVSRRSREVAAESSRLSRIAFANGTGTSFDLIEAARRLRETDLDLAIREFELVRAHLAALLALARCDI
jgi:outer membrane protein TolC